MNILTNLYPGDSVMGMVAVTVIQVTVVLLLAELATSLLRHRSAAARYSVWLCALVCVLIAPAVTYLANRSGLSLVEIPVLVSRSTQPFPAAVSAPPPQPEFLPAVASSESLTPAPGPEIGPPEVPTNPELPIQAAPTVGKGRSLGVMDKCRLAALAVLTIWMAGSLVCLVRLIWGYCLLNQLRRSAEPIDEDHFGGVLNELRQAIGLRRSPRIVLCEQAPCPLATGVIRPMIILPEETIEKLTNRQLRDVLMHEYAHILHRDLLVGLAQRIAMLIYWPHILIYRLNRQLSRTREEICDNHVLRCSDRAAYARTLLAISERMAGFRRVPLMVTITNPRWKLEDRVAGILDKRRTLMTRINALALVGIAAAMLFAGISVAGARLKKPKVDPEQVPPRANTAIKSAKPKIIIYDAALGTLPQQQGWMLRDDLLKPAVPTVQGGILHQGPTTDRGNQDWVCRGQEIDFTRGFCMEAKLKVISSSYVVDPRSGARRAGWSMSVIDKNTDMFSLYIASDRILIHQGQHTTSMLPKLTRPSFDPTDGFHTYQFVVGKKTDLGAKALGVDKKVFDSLPKHVAAVFIDESKVAFLYWYAGIGSADRELAGDKNTVFFGDRTDYVGSQTQLKYFAYSNRVTLPPRPTLSPSTPRP